MRKLAVLFLAVLALLAVAPSGIASAATPSIGRLEGVQTNTFTNTLTLTGWALDPNERGLPTVVDVTIDGVPAGGWRFAQSVRTDVNRSQGAAGGHGFTVSVTVPVGSHTICMNSRLRSGAQSTSLGCFAFQAYPMATAASMAAIARTIDPGHTISWKWTALPAGTAGLAQPWNSVVEIGAGVTTRNLRAVMLHEWSHVLQYRAFAGSDPWWDAVQAFNALLGHPVDRTSYDGVEHGADCIALALGADYLGYGCPAALKTYGALIARGVKMNTVQGALTSTRSAGRTVTVTGWALDPASPTTPTTYRITDNGVAVTGWLSTGIVRTDVNAATGVTGAHGFSITVAAAKGSHRICLSARFIRTGQPASTLACSTVQTA